MGAHANLCEGASAELRSSNPVSGPKALDQGDSADSSPEALSQGVVSGGILAQRVQARVSGRTGKEACRRGLDSHQQVYTAEISDKGPVCKRRAEK